MEKATKVSKSVAKVAQALGFLLSLDDNCKMNRVKLIKLLWAADRIHVRRYGRTITNLDDYYALPHGPVCSLALNIARFSNIEHDGDFSEDEVAYFNEYFTSDSKDTSMQKNPGNEFLSESDEQALREAWEKFKDEDPFVLADKISHQYPEWKKYEGSLMETGGRMKISTEDFFQNPEDDKYFSEDKAQLEAAYVLYKENSDEARRLAALLSWREDGVHWRITDILMRN